MGALTLASAVSLDALPMMAMIRLKGRVHAEAMVGVLLSEIDDLSGGRTPEDTLAMLAIKTVDRYKYRSVRSLLMALRDGFYSTDKDDKVYGQLTWGTISSWLSKHEEDVIAYAEAEAASGQEVPENKYGSHHLNAMTEPEKEKKASERKDRLIEHLKNKLDGKST